MFFKVGVVFAALFCLSYAGPDLAKQDKDYAEFLQKTISAFFKQLQDEIGKLFWKPVASLVYPAVVLGKDGKETVEKVKLFGR